MSDKDKNHTAKDNNVQPPRVLHPVFGTHCRTQCYGMKTGDDSKTQHVHFEIYLEDPVKKTWAINKISVTSTQSFFTAKAITRVSTSTVAKKMDFTASIAALSLFEKDCADNPAMFKPLYPAAADMGFTHFKAFAEREGYVFDKSGMPKVRPHALVLPDGEFDEIDVTSAAKNLQRPDDAFDNNGTANKIPNTLFIFDTFNNVARKTDMADALTEVRIINILDRLASSVEKAHGKLQEYCQKYEELGQGGLISDAETELQIAEVSVRQLKAYGLEMSEFESFVTQCQTLCHVLHAQGLYDLMHKGKGDYDLNEAAFKDRATKAVESHKRIDPSDKGMYHLQEIMVAAPPEVPNAIRMFLTNYEYQRSEFTANRASRPKGPRP